MNTLVASIGYARVLLDVDARDNVTGATVENDGPGSVIVEVVRPSGKVITQTYAVGVWTESLPGNRRFSYSALTADWGLHLTPTGG